MQVTPDAGPFVAQAPNTVAAHASSVHQPRDKDEIIHSPDSDEGHAASPATSASSSDMEHDDAGPASEDVLALQRQLTDARATQRLSGTGAAGKAHASNIHDLTAQLDNRFEALMLSPEHQVPLLYNSLGRKVSLHGVHDGQEVLEPWGRTAVFGASLPSTAANSLAHGGVLVPQPHCQRAGTT